jgi:hypothetical protein
MSEFKFSSEAFMLGQISCEMIALARDLTQNHGEKLNGELKALDKIVQRVDRVKNLIHKKDEPI